LRSLGAWLMPQLIAQGRPLHARLLLTHLHYDHLLGLPFFAPLEDPGAILEVFGPGEGERSLAELVDDVVKPPFFPVQVRDFRGTIHLSDSAEEPMLLGRSLVSSAPVPHTGVTLGYRVEVDGVSVVYIPDHQAPLDREEIDPDVLALCRGADLLIHDAQYDELEFARKADWGHSTVAYAVHVAAAAEVKSLALFHHDPSHSDERLLALEAMASTLPGAEQIGSIVSAFEGLTISLGS
jgi:ribonuclease BN (tRNA processing enzyme)